MSLDSQEQRISYGIAMNMGRRMKAEGVPIDADAFAEGLRDALSGAEAKMSRSSSSPVVSPIAGWAVTRTVKRPK